MGTGTFYPGSLPDDGQIENGALHGSGHTSIWFGERSGHTADAFFRFVSVTIPRASTITTAYIRLRAANSDSGIGCNMKIYANDSGDASAPTTPTQYYALVMSSLYVDWNPESFVSGSWYSSPELKTILQSIIDRSDFESGNAIQIVLKNNSSTDERFAYCYEKGSSYYPQLYVEWTPNTLTESIVIDSPPNVRELINRIAYEASSVEYWDAGAHNLVYLPTHTTVSKTIDANRIDAESVDVRYTDRVDLLNSLTLWYNYYWSGYSGDDAFRGTVIDSDATSIAKYGTLEKEAFQFKYLEGAQNAERAIAWLLNELKNPRLIVSFTGGYYLTDIRRSNLINFDFEDGDELDIAFSGLVSTTDKFMVTDIVRRVGSIEIEAVQLIAVPMPVSTTFYPVTTADDGVYKTPPDVFSTAGLLWMGLDYTKYYNHFIRFLNVTIPAGATIISAYVTYTASDSAGPSSYVKTSLHFNDEDSPAAPTSIAEFQALSLTSAVDWSPDVWVRYSKYDTPELKTILQDVIDRPGWNTGQAVMLVLRDDGSTSDKAYTTQQIRGAYSVDPAYSDDYMPVLHVTYIMT